MLLVLFVGPHLRVDSVPAAEADILRPTEIDPDRMLAADWASIHIDGIENGAEAAIHSGL
jgi:hypothetical protein